jgi:hypothetical protein
MFTNIAVIATFYVFGITYANQIIERIMVDNALHQRLNAHAGALRPTACAC